MTRHEIARLICKTIGLLFAIVSVVSLLPYINWIGFYYRDYFAFGFTFSSFVVAVQGILPWVVTAVVAAALWFAPDFFASRMVSSDPEPVTSLVIQKRDVNVIVFAACGIFVFVEGINDLTVTIVLAGNTRTDSFEIVQSPDFWGPLLTSILGLWLILGSRGIVGMIERLRSWRSDRPPQTESTDEPNQPAA